LNRAAALIAGLLVAVGILVPGASARPAEGTRATDAKLTLVAYSTPREAYAKIIPLFQKSPAGAGVTFEQSYGSSGEQARAVLAGLAADVVALSLVTVQDKSARESLQTFLSGKGDVLLAYENEAFFANLKGQKVPYVIPRSTILIENPVAVVNKTAHPKEANAFVSFLRTPAAQKIYAENGYRPVLKSVARQYKFPARPGIFTINQLGLGGWTKVQKQFFDPRNGVFTVIQRKAAGG
jgi:ABC-type sulfate transport system substrate-binding protein